MNYLKYIEHSAENLQFYLWYLDYSARFEKLPSSQRALSPPWSKKQAESEAVAPATVNRTSKPVEPHISAIFKNTEFATVQSTIVGDKTDPFGTPDKTPSLDEKRDQLSEYGSMSSDEKTTVSSSMHKSMAENAFDDAGLKWKPCKFGMLGTSRSDTDIQLVTSQPYRDEVSRIISTYLMKGGARELNLSDRERSAILHGLQNTTHPSAFKLAAINAEYALRRQSHANFIRWTICNGNRSRVVFARGLGIAGIVGGLLADLLITLSHASRGWRVLPIVLWFIGISTLIAAWKGMCVVLHGMHHRHVRPWELFLDDSAEILNEKTLSSDSLASSSANSFEDEPWVARYKKRNVIRKIFDRELWIEEPALRQIQDTIFLQAILCAFVLSCIFVGIFCAVPKGNSF